MGKSRGGKKHYKPGGGRPKPGGGRGEEGEEDSDEETVPAQRSLGELARLPACVSGGGGKGGSKVGLSGFFVLFIIYKVVTTGCMQVGRPTP